ncbi:MAG: hypothetical protein RLY93_13645 [Sumerlaeia bacterium]
MIAKVLCTPDAQRKLSELTQLRGGEGIARAEIEFREVPYFLVSRARTRDSWLESGKDINAMRVMDVSAAGLIIDPDSEPLADDPNQARRHTFVPWTNVISLTVERPETGASPDAPEANG